MTAVAVLRLLPPRPPEETLDRTWCFECYERREEWVIRLLGEHGVTFRELVLEEDVECRSCRAVVCRGAYAVRVSYPLRRARDAGGSR